MMNGDGITQISTATNNLNSDLDMAKATVDNIPNLSMESSAKTSLHSAALPVQRKRERLDQFKKAKLHLMR